MTKAEQLYTGKVGEEYWERNQARLEEEGPQRRRAIHRLLPPDIRLQRWVEVGCGQGHNLWPGDVGVDIDARQLAHLPEDVVGIVAPAYNLPLPDKSYDVAFTVGCLMHLQHEYFSGRQSWQSAVAELARVAREYIIIGEYWADREKEIEWHGEKGVLWARDYKVPGFEMIHWTQLSPPFDQNITFGVFQRVK